MFCHQCGTRLPEKARFCPGCGAPVAAPSGEAQTRVAQTVEQVKEGGGVVGVAQGGTVMVGVVQHYYSQAHPGAAPEEAQRRQAALQRGLGEYLDWLEESFGTIVLRGIEQQGRQVVSLPLDTVYVPLEAEVTPEADGPGAAGEGRRPAQDGAAARGERRTLSLDRALALGPRLILTGGPGCGKSTVLQHIAWTLARAHKRDDPSLAQEALGLPGPLPLPLYIPLNQYADYLRSLPKSASGQERSLLAFIAREYPQRRQMRLGLDADFLSYLLEGEEQILLLLDGLDEVPDERQRVAVRAAIEDLTAGRPRLRAVVTSRSAAYQGKAVFGRGFRHVRVLPLRPEQVEAVVRAAYQAIYPHSQALRDARAGELLDGIRRLEAARRQRLGKGAEALVTSPLMVRMLLIVHFNHRRLPDQRADLYQKAVDAMLRPDFTLDEQVADDIEHRIGGSLAFNRELFQHLAYHMHAQGAEQGREIDEDALERILCGEATYQPYVSELIAQTRQRCTLMEERGGRYRFIHLSFQEFLAGRYLVYNHDLEAIARLFEQGRARESWWREPALLAVGYLDITAPLQARRLLQRLAGLDEDAAARDRGLPLEAQLAAAELAAAACLECRNQAADLGAALQGWLKTLLWRQEGFPAPALRAAAADALDALGWLPEDLYRLVEIDPSRLAYADPRLPTAVYYLGKYPVTNAQYARFLAAEDFAERALWVDFPKFGEDSQRMAGASWGEAGWEWLQEALKGNFSPDGRVVYPRYWNDPRFGAVRRGAPVVGITWYEANAYCRWLLRHWAGLDEASANPALRPGEVRLPAEAEWIAAAGGDRPGERYPWDAPGEATRGEREILPRANTREGKIGRTTPVGLYPSGASQPYGVWDMAGNAWEWQANFYPGRDGVLALRGGAWLNESGYARLSERHRYDPDNEWYVDLGFRVLARPY